MTGSTSAHVLLVLACSQCARIVCDSRVSAQSYASISSLRNAPITPLPLSDILLPMNVPEQCEQRKQPRFLSSLLSFWGLGFGAG